MMRLCHSLLRDKTRSPLRGLVILDRDGILIRDTGYPHKIEGAEINHSLLAFLSRLREHGYGFGFASNQGGIGLGLYGWPAYFTLTRWLDNIMAEHNAQPDFWLACAAHPEAPNVDYRDGEHLWRKPQPGMLLHAMSHYGCSAHNTWFIGDRETDMIAAERAGVTGIKYTGWLTDYPADDGAVSDVLVLEHLLG